MNKNILLYTIVLSFLFPTLLFSQSKLISILKDVPMYRLSKKYKSDTLHCASIYKDIKKANITYTETPMELPFVGCSNRDGYSYISNNLDRRIYDMYIVSYQGKQWGVFYEYVENAQYIDSLNWTIYIPILNEFAAKSDSVYDIIQELVDEGVDSHKEKLQYDSLSLKMCENHIDSLISIRSTIRTSIMDSIFKGYQKESQVLYNQLSSNGKKTVNSLMINKALLLGSNSVGGHDCVIRYQNLSDKDIKYFRWSGYAKNNVGDDVYCEVTRKIQFSGYDVGPVKHLERGGGVWENIIYNYSAKTLVLNSVIVEYMNGTSLSINERDLSILSRMKVFPIPNTNSSFLLYRDDMYVYGSDIPESLKKYEIFRVETSYPTDLNKDIDIDSRITEIQQKILSIKNGKDSIETQIKKRVKLVKYGEKIKKLKRLESINSDIRSMIYDISYEAYLQHEIYERFTYTYNDYYREALKAVQFREQNKNI